MLRRPGGLRKGDVQDIGSDPEDGYSASGEYAFVRLVGPLLSAIGSAIASLSGPMIKGVTGARKISLTRA